MSTLLVLFVSCVVLSGAQSITGEYGDIANIRPTENEYPECNEPNEVLNHCVKPCGGEDSCYDRNQYACAAVVLPCIPKCVCKEGFIRKTLGRECIPKEECPGPCEDVTQYTECKRISKEICSSITNPSKSNDSGEECQPGCTCWDGYYRKNATEPCQHRCLCPGMENEPDCDFWRKLYE
ncbi:hypothetical protein PYW08_014951 [Mythimna loreyi]|uniref:Uncharacterized protein n=1 Tax=Mythimna loreyi TaxID=667449 RepID=A0ACC2R3K4_9NEOP|nr:hypothetical protein PYW08_014951 [Mythimna loreyi]